MAAIRRLTPDDVEVYRTIRLEALNTHPEAFGTSAVEEAAKPIQTLQKLLEGTAVFGGFADGQLSGIAALHRPGIEKERHKATLWGVYVAKSARGSGLAGALVDEVLTFARQHVIQVHLAVGQENLVARQLYESRGFIPYGVAPRALKLGERYLDEILMVCRLDESA